MAGDKHQKGVLLGAKFLFINQQVNKLQKAVRELTRAIHLQPDQIELYIIRYWHRNQILQVLS